jgi:hypothetical protein
MTRKRKQHVTAKKKLLPQPSILKKMTAATKGGSDREAATQRVVYHAACSGIIRLPQSVHCAIDE